MHSKGPSFRQHHLLTASLQPTWSLSKGLPASKAREEGQRKSTRQKAPLALPPSSQKDRLHPQVKACQLLLEKSSHEKSLHQPQLLQCPQKLSAQIE